MAKYQGSAFGPGLSPSGPSPNEGIDPAVSQAIERQNAEINSLLAKLLKLNPHGLPDAQWARDKAHTGKVLQDYNSTVNRINQLTGNNFNGSDYIHDGPTPSVANVLHRTVAGVVSNPAMMAADPLAMVGTGMAGAPKLGWGARLTGAKDALMGKVPAAAAAEAAATAPAAAGMSKAAKVAIGLGTSGVALAGAKAAKDIYYDPWKEAKIEEMRDAPGGINEKKRAEAARANAFEMAMKNAETERTMQESALAERAKVEIAKFNSQAEIAKALIGMQQGPANAYADMAKTAAQQAAYLPKASVDIFDAISLSPVKDPRFASIANAGAAAGSAPPNP